VIGTQLKVAAQSLLMFDVFSNRFHREFKNHEDVSDIRDNDTVAVYEVTCTDLDIPVHKRPKNLPEQSPTKKRLYVLSREEEYGHRVNMGNPFVISVDVKVTYRQLYNALAAYLQSRNHIQPQPEGSPDIFKVLPLNYSYSYSQYYSSSKNFADNDQPFDIDDKESLACEFTKDNRKYFYDRVDEQVKTDPSAAVINETSGKDQISLYECLRLFTSEEQLSSNDAWYCSECKEFREAYKKFDIWSAPKLLVVHLKRFSAVNRVWRERLDNLVDFPIDNLDLTEFVIGPKKKIPRFTIYTLYRITLEVWEEVTIQPMPATVMIIVGIVMMILQYPPQVPMKSYPELLMYYFINAEMSLGIVSIHH